MNFSAYSNTVKLFDVNIPKNANHLECLDGIRFLSISWVVLGHTLSNVIQYFSITDVSFVSRVNRWSLISLNFSSFYYFSSYSIHFGFKQLIMLMLVLIHFSWWVDVWWHTLCWKNWTKSKAISTLYYYISIDIWGDLKWFYIIGISP